MGRIVIIDGKNYFTRMFHVALVQKKNIMFFVINNLIDYVNKHQKNSKIVFVFDTCKSKRRLEIYPEYKAGRVSSLSPEDQKLQRTMLNDFMTLLKSSKFTVCTGYDYEADDYIAKLTQLLQKTNFITINSMDEDFLQLVNNKVEVFLPTKQLTITNDIINDYLGIDKQFFMDYKCIKGDKSDNIPGIKGIGEKTIVKYIKEFGSYAEILEGIKNKKKLTKTDQKFLNGVEDVKLYKKVIDMKHCFEDDNLKKITIKQVKSRGFNKENILKIAKQYDLKKLVKDFLAIKR